MSRSQLIQKCALPQRPDQCSCVVGVFQTWHDYDQRAWTQCRDVAASMQVSSLSGARVIGNDMNDGNLAKCKRAARAAGVLHLLDLSCEPSRHYRPPLTPSLVVTNPPCSAPLTYSRFVNFLVMHQLCTSKCHESIKRLLYVIET